MKNPFPGMNPYLELRWRDVHARLVVYMGDMLQRKLPLGLQARIEEDVTIDFFDGEPRLVRPDTFVSDYGRGGNVATAATGIETSTPMIFELDDPPPARHVEIVDVEGDRVVTAIELLSVTNKTPGDDRDRYRKKQRANLAAGVNLIEIDLLRQGEYTAAFDMRRLPVQKRRPFVVSVHRAKRTRQFEVYGSTLRERLPVIAVPLRPTDADIALDIQQLIDDYHERSGFSAANYRKPVEPPLPDEENAWATAQLASAGVTA